MRHFVKRLIRTEEGATALEYGLLAALIATAIVTAVSALGTQMYSVFDAISNDISSASS